MHSMLRSQRTSFDFEDWFVNPRAFALGAFAGAGELVRPELEPALAAFGRSYNQFKFGVLRTFCQMRQRIDHVLRRLMDRAGDLGQRHFLVEQQWNQVASKHNSRAAISL